MATYLLRKLLLFYNSFIDDFISLIILLFCLKDSPPPTISQDDLGELLSFDWRGRPEGAKDPAFTY
jgi:hypothetical protein